MGHSYSFSHDCTHARYVHTRKRVSGWDLPECSRRKHFRVKGIWLWQPACKQGNACKQSTASNLITWWQIMGLPQWKFPEMISLTEVGFLMTFHKLFMTQLTVSYSKTRAVRELQHVSFTTFPLAFCSSLGSSCYFWSRGVHFLLGQRCHSWLSWEKIGGNPECGWCCLCPDRQTPLQARTNRFESDRKVRNSVQGWVKGDRN